MTQVQPAMDDRLNAFCKDTEAYLEGTAGGPPVRPDLRRKGYLRRRRPRNRRWKPRLAGYPRPGRAHCLGRAGPGGSRRNHGRQDSDR